MLNKGDHVIFSSETYIAVYRLLNELLNNKFGVETGNVLNQVERQSSTKEAAVNDQANDDVMNQMEFGKA